VAKEQNVMLRRFALALILSSSFVGLACSDAPDVIPPPPVVAAGKGGAPAAGRGDVAAAGKSGGAAAGKAGAAAGGKGGSAAAGKGAAGDEDVDAGAAVDAATDAAP
jgi:hypothetical protein